MCSTCLFTLLVKIFKHDVARGNLFRNQCMGVFSMHLHDLIYMHDTAGIKQTQNCLYARNKWLVIAIKIAARKRPWSAASSQATGPNLKQGTKIARSEQNRPNMNMEVKPVQIVEIIIE